MEIRLEGVEKSYLKKIIFSDLTTKFESNKRYGISGFNGSGKSTLLKILAGFITPNEGRVDYRIGNKNIPIDDIFKYVSFAAPYLDIPTELSFYEILDFHFSAKNRLNNLTNDQINTYFHLPKHIPIRQFSSGMLQRVKLALAFFSDSLLLLLDEPTETLDVQGFELYAILLERFGKHRTILIASNKEKDFINCDSILRLNDYHESTMNQ